MIADRPGPRQRGEKEGAGKSERLVAGMRHNGCTLCGGKGAPRYYRGGSNLHCTHIMKGAVDAKGTFWLTHASQRPCTSKFGGSTVA